ncbi:unnamed protein product [Cuscuta campestris]|uniref:AP2/ERF domain-containing protein n=1 Tax=Cuscuta campestris TaxID=132261 RepID=A0A484LWD5_9ASTE|nr:unnamed protein product [Cuscuta campestris]
MDIMGNYYSGNFLTAVATSSNFWSTSPAATTSEAPGGAAVSSPLSSDDSSTAGCCSSFTATTTNNNMEDTMSLACDTPKKRAGRKKFRETRHPVYRGVRSRSSGKWVCEVREPNKKSRIWLGTFPTPEMAARAHDVAAIALRGHSACLNFADSAWRLPVPASLDPRDIQKAAAEAAEAFRSEPTAAAAGGYDPERNAEAWMVEEEDVILETPGFFADMAEALMLPPPHYEVDRADDYVDSSADVPLWSYSF